MPLMAIKTLKQAPYEWLWNKQNKNLADCTDIQKITTNIISRVHNISREGSV